MSDFHPNLLTVVPGNINIENFVPGRIYKESLMIYNTCSIPIVINLKPSDKNKLTLSDTDLRIGVNQAKKIDIIIQDKLNYKYTKLPIQPKKLLIQMKGELIDVKYEINLIYYNKNNKNLRNNKKNAAENSAQINSQSEIKDFNNMKNEKSQRYLSLNPNSNLVNDEEEFNENFNNNIDNISKNNMNYMNNNNTSIENNDNIYCENLYQKYDISNFQNFPINQDQNYNNISERKINNQDNNSNEVKLKLIINNLLEKISCLKYLLDLSLKRTISQPNNNNNFDQLTETHESLFYIQNSKLKQENNLERDKILPRDKILEMENSVLQNKIKRLEEKLNFYESKNINENLEGNNMNNYNNNFSNIRSSDKLSFGNYINKNNNEIINTTNKQNYLIRNNYENLNEQNYEHESPRFEIQNSFKNLNSNLNNNFGNNFDSNYDNNLNNNLVGNLDNNYYESLKENVNLMSPYNIHNNKFQSSYNNYTDNNSNFASFKDYPSSLQPLQYEPINKKIY